MVDEKIQNLMWKEVGSKSLPAAIVFSGLATFFIFHPFDSREFSTLIQVSCGLIIVANIMRIAASWKIQSLEFVSHAERFLLKIPIWLNSFCWGLVFSLVTYETNGQGPHFIIAICIMLGFTAASIVTLAYDKLLFLPHNLFSLIPILAIFTYQYLSGVNPNSLMLLMTFVIYLVYQLKQFKDYQSQLTERFSNQLELQHSYAELKKGQELLIEQTAKLIHASRLNALGEMAGGLSHEINNSAMVILGSVHQMGRELEASGAMNEKIEARISTVTNSISRIKTVIDGLKFFSQEMPKEKKELVALSEIIERSFNYTQEMLREHNIHLEISEIPPAEILCHRFQLTQILFNIIKNADDVLAEESDTNRWIKISFERYEQSLLIRIINSGPRPSKEVQDKLFQPFFTTKDVGLGMGLSLSISKGMAREHGGDLYYEENPEGTCFVLKLPFSLVGLEHAKPSQFE